MLSKKSKKNADVVFECSPLKEKDGKILQSAWEDISSDSQLNLLIRKMFVSTRRREREYIKVQISKRFSHTAFSKSQVHRVFEK